MYRACWAVHSIMVQMLMVLAGINQGEWGLSDIEYWVGLSELDVGIS